MRPFLYGREWAMESDTTARPAGGFNEALPLWKGMDSVGPVRYDPGTPSFNEALPLWKGMVEFVPRPTRSASGRLQ